MRRGERGRAGRRALRRALLAAAGACALAGASGAESPQVDYMLHCRGCHGPDGAGLPGAVPRLQGFVGEFLGVPGGRAYLVRVPGSSESPLDDAALAAVLNWMVSSFGPPQVAADFTPFTGEEVARTRRPPLQRVGAVRAALVAEIERRKLAAAH